MQANQLFLKRSGNPLGGAAAQSSADKCDGQDELGCYQVSHFHGFYLIFFVNYGRCNFGLKMVNMWANIALENEWFLKWRNKRESCYCNLAKK